jgi:hypothetical protein
MKYAVEISSSVTMCIPSFIKIVSGIQKLIGGMRAGSPLPPGSFLVLIYVRS